MSLRRTLQENPSLTNGLTVGVIVIALGFIALQVGTHRATVTPAPKLFYTTDDGKNLFPDDAQKLPPFDHEGKSAVRAYVFSCDRLKTKRFVAYLERLSPAIRDKIAAEMGRSQSGTLPPESGFEMSNGTEVKRPGDADWVKRSSAAGEAIQNVKCPAGKKADDDGGEPIMVSPGD